MTGSTMLDDTGRSVRDPALSRLLALLDERPGMVACAVRSDGTIVAVSRAGAAGVLGIESTEIVGRRLQDLVDDARTIESALARVEDTSDTVVVAHATADGTRVRSVLWPCADRGLAAVVGVTVVTAARGR